MPRPRNEEDWEALRAEAYASFSPGAPIKLQSDLAGRDYQARRLREIVLSAGEHALVYGERGVGKTSIANTFHLSLTNDVRRVHHLAVNCGEADFNGIWRKVFRRIRVAVGEDQRALDQLYPNPITTDDVEIELQNFQINDQPIIVLDEFDKISDHQTKSMVTELIKSLSDHTVHAKLVLVGIANNAGELIAKHASISRALKQVQMPRLSLNELEKTVSSRYKKCDLRIEDEVLFQIAFLSRGLPYYAHLLGRHSAVHAIDERRTSVGQDDLIGGLKAAIEEVDQTITEDYLKATVSQKPEETLFEPVLIACALADSDDLGQFQQASVAAPLSEIVPKTPAYTAATFAFHMNEFCEEKRKKILQRSGETRNFRYSFVDAMMQPYVIIRALQTGRLKRSTFDRFIVRRQKELSV